VFDFTGPLLKRWASEVVMTDKPFLRQMIPTRAAEIEEACASVFYHYNLMPFLFAAGGLERLSKRGHRLTYLSGRHPYITDATRECLSKHGCPPAPVMCMGRGEKAKVLTLEFFDVLIDDDERYLAPARDAGLQAIAFRRPWNHAWTSAVISSWEGVEHVITG
jgi:hypothetical protein